MSLHKEINLEVEICEHLAAHGWLYAEGDAATYDRARACGDRSESRLRPAREELDALILFKADMGAYQRLDTFLSQIFDYGNSAIISAMEANAALSSKALNSADVRRGIRELLLNHVGLWEALRERAEQDRNADPS